MILLIIYFTAIICVAIGQNSIVDTESSDIPIGNTGLQCQNPPYDITRLFPSGTIIQVSCPDDYDLVGPDKSQCDYSGLWSTNGIGYCKYRKTVCPTPEIPPNAFVRDQTNTAGEYLVGNYIQFGCDLGYDLIGLFL